MRKLVKVIHNEHSVTSIKYNCKCLTCGTWHSKELDWTDSDTAWTDGLLCDGCRMKLKELLGLA